mmetsp:Transcript_14156/g.20663  ORF Transcript_14156/g.20663 Transcript_14156/m.20663 type:complete len:102 (+) Transcript_14156:6195-6500(+)
MQRKAIHGMELWLTQGILHLPQRMFSRTTYHAQPYLSTVVQIFVESGGRIKPADAWKLFQEKHPAPESESTCYPPMSKIKSKISALKAAYKKSNCLPIIPE